MRDDDIYRSQFRLPYRLYEALKRVAEENHRSLNAEIVARLEASLGEDRERFINYGLPPSKQDGGEDRDRMELVRMLEEAARRLKQDMADEIERRQERGEEG